ncbi:hypothetical protein M569_03463, partial [Genlisea aurea]
PKIPMILFIPAQELVGDTYRLAAIARDIGMDLQPNPTLSHIVFSWPASSSSSPSPCGSSSSSSKPSLSSPFAWSLPDNSVPLPFPSFNTASLCHLRRFVSLSKGYFKLVFVRNNGRSRSSSAEKMESLSNNNWHCSSLSLFASHSGERISSMDGFSQAMLGRGWTLFKSHGCEKKLFSGRRNVVYLYRKMAFSGKCLGNGNLSRVKELKFPCLDFRDMPLRMLQYILLMTDDIFYLA